MQFTLPEVLNLLGLAFIAGGVWVNFNYMRKNMVTKDGLKIALQSHELTCRSYDKGEGKPHVPFPGASNGDITEY